MALAKNRGEQKIALFEMCYAFTKVPAIQTDVC